MKSIYKTLALVVLLCSGQLATAQNFITQWNLATPGSGATQLSFGTATSGIVNYTWQEISPGSASGSGSWSGATLTITGLPAGATIRLQIAPTNFERIRIDYGADSNRLTQVESWGSTAWTSMGLAFAGCTSLQIGATDAPNLLSVFDMYGMFSDCTVLNSPSNINTWNTAAVTNMTFMFFGALAFNQNIGSWNTGAVISMAYMFKEAYAFNQDIGAWNTGAVISMAYMFEAASAFNQNIGSWNTAAVTDMGGMFYGAIAFNNGGNGSINNWNTGAVTNMASMFSGASFNQNIGSWNTSAVTDMSGMFLQDYAFNQDIGTWNTASVTNMGFMFQGASAFNQNIGAWNTGAVTNMSNMFNGANSFNQNISSWNTGAVTDMSFMFSGGAFNQNIGSWNTGAVTDMSFMFSSGAFNQNIGSWNTAAVTDMSYMFYQASAFNQDIGSWNTNAVTDMSFMFWQAAAFNQDIGTWNTVAVTNMTYMFFQAFDFNQNIGLWNTGAVTNMSHMFHQASDFDQNIGSWNTGAVADMSYMFQQAIAFNQNIGSWDTGAVTRMENMFGGAIAFNQNIGSWNTAAVTSMSSMFSIASAFNQNIGSWNTGAVIGMSGMFYQASAFNQNIGSWNTAAVISMGIMFQGASAFNQNIGAWNTAAVTDMSSMFFQALAFNQNIGAWTLKPGVNLGGMLNNSGMDCNNYSATMIGWNSNPSTPNGRTLGALGRQYGTNAVAARTNLTTTKGWTITGDAPSGAVCAPPALVPTITSFTPTTGPIGTTITITGTNFSTTPANNTVYFGPVSATVTAATATQLTVTVPTGATLQPIAVQVAGLTASSINPFIVTFTGGGTIDACSFAPKVNLGTTGTPNRGTLGDVDGDGKPDLIIPAGQGFSNISIYRNISTTGTIVPGSFAPAVNFTTGTDPYSVSFGDLDSDGKPDLAVVNYSGTLSVFKNISTSGTIALAAKVDFAIPGFSHDVSISDIDGDGKQDLALTSFTVGFVVLRNTGSVGVINASTFAAGIGFSAGANPFPFSLGDIDGDGKIDAAVPDRNTDIVSVLRNTSTPGTVSFAALIPLAIAPGPPGQGAAWTSLGDIDGDSKMDLLVSNPNINTVAIFRNTSSTGIVSFSPRFDLSTASLPVVPTLSDLDGDGKIDLTIDLGGAGVNTIAIYKNTSTSGTINASTFAAPVALATPSSRRFIAGDIDGDGKNELVSYLGTVAVLQNVIGTLAAPSVSSFSPGSGASGTSVTIIGTNFSTPFSNVVTFNGVPGTITGSTATTLTVAVPVGATSGPLDVTIGCNTINAGNFVVPAPPTITSFSPASGPIGTSVTITGTNFDAVPVNNIVYFGAVRATVTAATATQLTVTAPTGATFQSITVQVNGLTAYSSKPFVVTFAGGGNIDLCSFTPPVQFGTLGGSPIANTVGDIDGDGKIDLLMCNRSGNTISIFRNTSTSGVINAGSFAPKIDFTTLSEPLGGAFGDLDGDGLPDLAVVNYSTGNISVFRNQSTPGTVSLSARVDFTAPSFTSNIAIFDLDGDGKAEIIISSTFSGITVYRNTSVSGTLNAASFASAINIPTGTNPFPFSIADLDGDNKPDLAIPLANAHSAEVRRNTSTIGSISFAAPLTLTTGLGIPPLGLGAAYSAAGDIDGDGKQDIVITNHALGTFALFRNTSTLGSLSFDPRVEFASLGIAGSPNLGDLDGDGKVDLIGYGTNSASVLRNTSTSGTVNSGSFAPLVSIPLPVGDVMSIADIDGDGRNDIVTKTANVSVLRNVVGTISVPTISSFSPSSGPVGMSVTITGTNFSTPFSNSVSFNGTPATITGSTATTLTVTVPVGATSGPLDVTIGCNTVNAGTFILPVPPTITSFTPTSGPIGTSVTITGTNFSTTPANNIVFFGATQATVTAATSTQLTVTVLTGATYHPISVLVNGLTAYSSSPFVVTFPGGGTIDACSLAPKVDFVTGTTPLSTYIGDLDGDGKADLVTGNQNANTISVYRNTSAAGVIDASSFTAKVDFAVATQPYLVVIGDIDGDGKPDLATSNEVGGNISVLRNTSVSGIINASSFAAAVNFSAGLGPHSVALSDLDADGKPELVTANFNSNTLSVFKNTSVTGAITSGSFAAKVDFATGTTPQSVAIADLDGDGKPDLAVTNGSGGTNTVSVLRNTTTTGLIDATSFAIKVDFTTGFFPRSLAIGDLDGDGKPDLAAANFSSNTVSVLRNTSTSGSITAGSFATKVDFVTASGPHTVTIGDVDGDAKPDLAVANGGSSSIGLFKNTSVTGSITTGSFSPRIDFVTALGPTNLAIGDLEGDGKPEVVVGVGGSNFLSVFRNTIGVPPPVPSSPVNGSFCGPGIVSLSVSGAAPSQYRWYTVPSGGTPIPGEVNATYVTPLISATTVYYTTITINSCESFTRTPVIATIESFPVPPTTPVNGVRCGPGSTIVTVSGGSAGQYRWYTVPIGGTALAGETAATYTTPVIASTTPYYASIHNGTCESATRTVVNAIVNTIPSDPTVPSVNGPFCSGSTFTFSTSGASPGEYRWYTVPAPGGTPISGATNGSYSTSLTTAVNPTHYVSILIGGCESGRQAATGIVLPLPTTPSATASPPACPDRPATLTATGGTNGEYRWYDGGSLIPAEVNSIFSIASLSATKTYQVSINNGICESLKFSVIATVATCTPPTIADNVSAPFFPGIIRIDLTPLLSDAEGNLDFSSIIIVGSLPSGATATIVGTELVIDYTGIAFPGVENIELKVCDLTGLCTTEILAVNLSSEITIFNALSPNNDGKNDIFFIENINMLPDTKDNKVMIFNRWGDVIFQVENYDNVSKVFQGLNNNGESVPAGTYFYRIDFKSGAASRTGFISLKK